MALNNASVYQKPSGNSKVIKKVKKGQKISFVGSTDKKGWIIVDLAIKEDDILMKKI